MRFVRQHFIVDQFYKSGVSYPTPANLTYFWNFGIYALVCFGIQFVTGVFLAMHYIPDVELAFASVENIMRNVNNGWLLRYIHANGASFFFVVVYIHIFRGLYYGSYAYPRQLLWLPGASILLLMIITAFLGYVLPWGQMSFWGATVITNLFSAIPIIGSYIVTWLWGGYAIDNATLTRFFSFHYILPIILAGIIFVHILFLHAAGSNNQLGISFYVDEIKFAPYYILKDLFGTIVFLGFFSFFVFFIPNWLGHPDNYIMANPLITPTHIVPEWYFLLFHAILRSIPNKLIGVVSLALAIICLFMVPIIHRPTVRSSSFQPILQYIFWFFVAIRLFLGWIGNQAVRYPFVSLGQIATVLYFFYFLVVPFILFLHDYLVEESEDSLFYFYPKYYSLSFVSFYLLCIFNINRLLVVFYGKSYNRYFFRSS
jgi:ubiquinol-cytochrome c reductase cytochrome b subunit